MQLLRLKLDPGSKTTGLVLVRDAEVIDPQTGEVQTSAVVLNLMELIYRGKQIVRGSVSFNIQSHQDGKPVVVQGISHKYCRVIQRADGYGYFFNRADNTGREQARPKARNAARSTLYLPGMNAEVSRAN